MTVIPPADDAHARELETRFRAAQKTQRRRAVTMRIGLNIAGILLVLALWEVTRFLPGVNEVLFPPPSIVISEAIPMIASGDIANNIVVKIGRAHV